MTRPDTERRGLATCPTCGAPMDREIAMARCEITIELSEYGWEWSCTADGETAHGGAATRVQAIDTALRRARRQLTKPGERRMGGRDHTCPTCGSPVEVR